MVLVSTGSVQTQHFYSHLRIDKLSSASKFTVDKCYIVSRLSVSGIFAVFQFLPAIRRVSHGLVSLEIFFANPSFSYG